MATSNRVRVVVVEPYQSGDPFGTRFEDPDDVEPGDEYQGPPPTGTSERLMRVVGRGPGESVTVSDLDNPRARFQVHARGDGTVTGTWRPAGTVSSGEIDRAHAAVTNLANTAPGQVGKEAGVLLQLFRGGLRSGTFAAAVDVLEIIPSPVPAHLEALGTVRLILLAEQAE